MTFAAIILLLVTAERLGELWLARRNTTALLKQGAFEVAPQHYTLIVLLHGFWLAGLWVLGWDKQVNLAWLMIFLIFASLACLGAGNARPTLDHAHHRAERSSTGDYRAIPLAHSPQLCGGGR